MMLHDGASVETVKEQFQELIRGVSHEEVAAMEQELIDSGFPVEEVTKLCDAHAAVFKEVLEAEEKRKTDSGHPIDTMRIENNAILASVEKLSPLLDRLSAGDSEILEAMGTPMIGHRSNDFVELYKRLNICLEGMTTGTKGNE